MGTQNTKVVEKSAQWLYNYIGGTMRLNLKMFYAFLFPLLFYVGIHAVVKYFQDISAIGYIIGFCLGVGLVYWWGIAKPFLFATDIKIIKENEV